MTDLLRIVEALEYDTSKEIVHHGRLYSWDPVSEDTYELGIEALNQLEENDWDDIDPARPYQLEESSDE